MPISQEVHVVPLSEAALRLAVRYNRALNWLQTKRLEGERRHGHYVVTVESVERVRQELEEAAPARARRGGA